MTGASDKSDRAAEVDTVAYIVANIRQGRSDTPRCEPPGQYAIDRAKADVKDVFEALAALTPSGEENPHGIAENKAGGLWYRRWFKAQQRVNELERTHKFWRAGEVGCPSDIKADNGELHTLRCKVCEMDNPRASTCRAPDLSTPLPSGSIEP